MSQPFQKTKPSFLEAGLPCASLSAECQRDNNARQRPPQNRLHIWWARRPPTICRAAILASLLPYDLDLDEVVLPPVVNEPSVEDLEDLPPKLQPHQTFFERLLAEVRPTQLTPAHEDFLRAMGITGDSARAWRRLALAEGANNGRDITLGSTWGYRHQRAFAVSPSSALLAALHSSGCELLQTIAGHEIVLLDPMAGGGSIPLEGIRYGFKVYANELNPVGALILKATLEYPSRFGRSLAPKIEGYAKQIHENVRQRLVQFFPYQHADDWWKEEEANAIRTFKARAIVSRQPAWDHNPIKNTYLWLRIVPCSRCDLHIPISTNFLIVSKKGKPEASIAAFPVVPEGRSENDCTFRIVSRAEWKNCIWPHPGFERWEPRGTPTFKDGKALCPRCGHVMDGDEVKAIARSREGGLATQMYAVCSQVPVKLTYRNGDVRVRYLWRFRAPTQQDLDAAGAAEAELARLRPRWEALDLIPTEDVPEGDKTREPRNMGLIRWRDLFLPRQLLTNVVILEEILAAQNRARAELPEAEAEAVSVYLAFMLSKVVNYNSVSSSWHDSRQQIRGMMMGHDFRFHAGFTEMEGSRETVMWGTSQVGNAYEELARLIHGEPVTLVEGGDDEEDVPEDEEAEDGDPVDEDEVETEVRAASASDNNAVYLRPEVIVPTITCDDAAALSEPAPGTVHLLCVDPPYYKNVQYAELSNFFYVWLKRALRDCPGLAPLFREPLADTNREAVANVARWQRQADAELATWQARYDVAYEDIRGRNVKAREAKRLAAEAAGPKPLTADERADRFYEDKMAACFRRARQLLHPAGRMVIMFNHKQTRAWRSLGMALIRAGFEIRSSVPIHTEAESSLNIRGLDAARSTILLLCLPREEIEQPTGNWGPVQSRVNRVARHAAELFQKQGLAGTDLYLSALGPALGEVGRNWPVTDFAGRTIDLAEALDEAYKAVGQWRLEQIFTDLTTLSDFAEVGDGFSAEAMDRDTQTMWLWLDTFQGETAQSDEVRKLAKSLNVDPNDFRRMGLLATEKDTFVLRAPQEVDLRLLSRRLRGEEAQRGRTSRKADIWEERVFPGFAGAAVWNAIALMTGTDGQPRGVEALRRWLGESGYGQQREFRGAFAVTLRLLEAVFQKRSEGNPWHEVALQARRAWDLVLHSRPE